MIIFRDKVIPQSPQQAVDEKKEALKASLNKIAESSGATNFNENQNEENRDQNQTLTQNDEPKEVKPQVPNKIFVGGISWSTSEEGLKSYFSKFGEVLTVDIMRKPHDNQPRGFGFITFAEASAVTDTCAKHMHEIDGKAVEVKPAIRKTEEAPRSAESHACKLFIGGITSDTRESDLEEYFSTFGKIIATVVMIDSNTGRGRGFGFVTYESREGADKVLKSNDHVIRGKIVDVKTYKGKPAGRDRDRVSRYGQSAGGMASGHVGGGGGYGTGGGYGGGGGGYYGNYYAGYGAGGASGSQGAAMYSGYGVGAQASGGYGQQPTGGQGGYGGGYNRGYGDNSYAAQPQGGSSAPSGYGADPSQGQGYGGQAQYGNYGGGAGYGGSGGYGGGGSSYGQGQAQGQSQGQEQGKSSYQGRQEYSSQRQSQRDSRYKPY